MSKEIICFMLKTYRADFELTKRLVSSFNRHNMDEIPLFILVEKPDFGLFSDEFLGGVVQVLDIDSIGEDLFTNEPVSGMTTGYVNQQIVKLTFWKLGLCDNYFCLDADGYFVRDFRKGDFIYENEVPYTVLAEDKALETSDYYYNTFWMDRQKSLDVIKSEMDLEGKHILTCHNCQIFNSKVLEGFESDFMKKKDYWYVDLIQMAPYEFAWYNFWLQKSGQEFIPRKPYFKMYHMAYQQVADAIQGINEESIEKEYIGVIINSNYTKAPSGSVVDINDLIWSGMNETGIDVLSKLMKGKNRLNYNSWLWGDRYE